jgi:hypothetical protein
VRLGCGGCLTAVLLGGVLIASLVLGSWAVSRALSDPGLGPPPSVTREDGVRAQRKLWEVLRGPEAPGGPRPTEITLSGQEANALASRHLVDVADLHLRGLSIEFDHRRVRLAARVPAGALLRESPFDRLATVLPTAWLQREVWLRIEGTPRVEAGARRRVLRLEVDRVWAGQQPLPEVVLRLLLSPTALGLLRWSLPAHVADVTVEPGRLIFKLAA